MRSGESFSIRFRKRIKATTQAGPTIATTETNTLSVGSNTKKYSFVMLVVNNGANKSHFKK